MPKPKECPYKKCMHANVSTASHCYQCGYDDGVASMSQIAPMLSRIEPFILYVKEHGYSLIAQAMAQPILSATRRLLAKMNEDA